MIFLAYADFLVFNNCEITEIKGLCDQKIQKLTETRTNKIQKHILRISKVIIHRFHRNGLMH